LNQHLQEAQLLFRVQGVSLVHSSHHNAALGRLAFLSLVIRNMRDFFGKTTWQRMHASLQE